MNNKETIISELVEDAVNSGVTLGINEFADATGDGIDYARYVATARFAISNDRFDGLAPVVSAPLAPAFVKIGHALIRFDAITQIQRRSDSEGYYWQITTADGQTQNFRRDEAGINALLRYMSGEIRMSEVRI